MSGRHSAQLASSQNAQRTAPSVGRKTIGERIAATAIWPIIEQLENRQLLSTTLASSGMSLMSVGPLAVTPLAAQPTVRTVNPAAGATNVKRDGFISADLNLPNGGIDKTTLSTSTVKLYRTSDGAAVPAASKPDTSGGGDVITYTPAGLLDSNTQYTFEVTSGVKDVTGAAMVPYKSTFTTGVAVSTTSTSIAFTKTTQTASAGQMYTCVTTGPDGRVYASTYDGYIYRFDVGSDGTLGTPKVISSVRTGNGGVRTITGIVFDPASTATDLKLWVTNTQYTTGYEGQDFTGKISRLTGTDLSVYTDYVIHLPRSVRDHLTEQPIIGPDGNMYFAQGANSSMGGADVIWGNRPEDLLSAAVLRLDLRAVKDRVNAGKGPLDVITTGATPYNPYAVGAPLTIYGSGVRNAYDLVWDSNGHLYAPTNGSAAGGNTPAAPGKPRTALTNVPVAENDYLFDIQPGKYYGHPNPTRGEYILDGGNPTSGVDPEEFTQYDVGTQPDSNLQLASYDFGAHASPDGVIEYKSNTFGGALRGKILVVRYSGGDDIVALSPTVSGAIDASATLTGVTGLTGFNDPLDLTEYINPANANDPRNGNVYVAELGGKTLTLLRPASTGGGTVGGGTGTGTGSTPPVTGEAGNPSGTKITVNKKFVAINDVRDGSTSPSVKLTITNKGTSSLTLAGLSISGTSASWFSITSNPGNVTLAAGQSTTVSLALNAPTSASTGIYTATLNIKSNDPTAATLPVELRGLVTKGTGGQNEPSLQRIFDLFKLNLKTGDANSGDTNLFSPSAPLGANDEVNVQRLVKAGSGSVSIQALASFAGGSPVSRIGYYTPGSTSSKSELFTVASGDAQTVNPTAVGTTSFDPGSSAFGLYVNFPIFGNTAYSEDGLNTTESTVANRRKIRFYPLKNPDGTTVANAYVFTSEDYINDPSGAYDTNDFIGIIRNVKIQSGGSGLSVTNTDGVPFDDRLVFNRIQVQPPASYVDSNTHQTVTPPLNDVHDKASVLVTNTSSSAITISSAVLNSSAWNIISSSVNGKVLQPGQSTTIQLQFVATGLPSGHTSNETDDVTGGQKNFGATWSGTLTINSNDPANPARKINLSGWWQKQSESNQEPSLPTLVNTLFGYKTNVGTLGQVNTGGKATAVGEEILSGYWKAANAGQAVTVRELSSYHTQGNTATLAYFLQSDSVKHTLFTQEGKDGQTLLPTTSSGTAAAGSFVSSSTFGFAVDNEYSVDSKNKQEHSGGGYGHHMRFWPARDSAGNLIANTYIMGMDYQGINYDYQDNLYLITNVKAATGAVPSDTGGVSPVSPPVSPPSSGVGSIASLVLMNAATDTDYATLTNGYTIDRTKVGTQFSVRANTTGSIGSVKFVVDGQTVHTETFAPYTIAGENGADVNPWSIATGSHTLSVIPYSLKDGGGVAGTALTISFKVI